MQAKIFNVYIQENQAVQDAYAMLTANIHMGSSKESLKFIALTSYKPGVGKTALTINLAASMAMSGLRVLLVDADIRKPKTAKRLNSESIFGLSDYLTGEVELEDALCKTDVQNLNYLSCGKSHTSPIGLLCSARFKELIDKARNEYDFVLFDTPALASVVDGAMIASKVDATILVVEMGQAKLANLKRAKGQLERANAKILGAVLNRVKKRDYKKHFESYNYFFDVNRFINKKNTENLITK